MQHPSIHTSSRRRCCNCFVWWLNSSVVPQLAAQLYPRHALLQLQPTSTSQLKLAVQKALAGHSEPSVLVVLSPPSSSKANKQAAAAAGLLVVDVALKVTAGQSLVLATPAALQQAAAAAAADGAAAGLGAAVPQLLPSELLQVSCKASKSGSFVESRYGDCALGCVYCALCVYNEAWNGW
jgi:hypothetical protein